MAYLNHSTATDGGATGSSVVVTKPSGVVDGNLMIWVVHADFFDSGTGAYSFPAGWTRVTVDGSEPDSTIDQGSLAVAYRVASGEGASYTCTLFQIDWWASVIIAYDNCPASPYDTGVDSGHDITADAGPSWTIDALSLTTATDNETLLWIAAIDNVTSIVTAGAITYASPTGFTTRGSVSDTNWCSIGWADKTQASAGASGSISSTASVASDTGNAGQISVLLAFKQNASAGNIAWITA
jgi:hypothetical protein